MTHERKMPEVLLPLCLSPAFSISKFTSNKVFKVEQGLSIGQLKEALLALPKEEIHSQQVHVS